MENNVVFYCLGLDAVRYPGWGEFYYLDEVNFPKMVLYNIVPFGDILGVFADDGYLTVCTRKDGVDRRFVCEGWMMPEDKFSEVFKFTDEWTVAHQKELKAYHKRYLRYVEKIKRISSDLSARIQSAMSHMGTNECELMGDLVSYDFEESKAEIVKCLDKLVDGDEFKPACYVNVSLLNPSVKCRVVEGRRELILNDDAMEMAGMLEMGLPPYIRSERCEE